MEQERIIDLRLVINGQPFSCKIPEDMTLLELLREECGLTGTKYGCGYGQCGACTVLLDGKPTRSCVTSVRGLPGRRVETIEGLGRPGQLDPIQAAFLKHGAYQCGYCTPGMILRIRGFLNGLSGRTPSRDEIASALRPHICRCGSYQRILDAAQEAAAQAQKEVEK